MHLGIEWCRCIEAFVGFTIDLFPPKRCWCNNINDRKTFLSYPCAHGVRLLGGSHWDHVLKLLTMSALSTQSALCPLCSCLPCLPSTSSSLWSLFGPIVPILYNILQHICMCLGGNIWANCESIPVRVYLGLTITLLTPIDENGEGGKFKCRCHCVEFAWQIPQRANDSLMILLILHLRPMSRALLE